MRRLVVAPHADDETMGCGGLIAKYPDTTVLIVAAPGEKRRLEMLDARDALGASGTWHTGSFPDGDVGQRQRALVNWLDMQMSVYEPEEVYLPQPGVHQDHIAVFEAGMRTCRQSLNPGHWMPPTVMVYETPTYDLEIPHTNLRFAFFETLIEAHVRAKEAAMRCYESQVQKTHAGSPTELVARALSLGVAHNVPFAEAYAPVRVVR